MALTKEELLAAAAQARKYPKGYGWRFFALDGTSDGRIFDQLPDRPELVERG